MRAVFCKDVKGYFHEMTGYLFVTAFLVFGGVYFVRYMTATGASQITDIFSNISVILILIMPILTMKSWAQEQKLGTDKLLLSGPLSIFSIVLAKILAAYTVFLAALGLTFVFPFILLITEHAAISSILLGYLGFALFGLSVITLGVFISSLSEHPIRAGIVTIISLLILWMVDNILPNISNPTLHGLLSVFSLFGKLLDFQYNFLRFSSIAYMVSFSVIFLLLTCKSVDLQRANKV